MQRGILTNYIVFDKFQFLYSNYILIYNSLIIIYNNSLIIIIIVLQLYYSGNSIGTIKTLITLLGY